jgi:hypothetical protein
MLNLQGAEGPLAAYIGFENVSDLQFLACTWQILQIWQMWHADATAVYYRHRAQPSFPYVNSSPSYTCSKFL